MSDRIEINPNIQHGKPVIHGTRVTVSCIIGCVASGMSFEQIQEDYDVTADDIRSALDFAAQLVEQEQYHPLPG